MMSLGSDWDSPEGFVFFQCNLLAHGLVWEMTSNRSGEEAGGRNALLAEALNGWFGVTD